MLEQSKSEPRHGSHKFPVGTFLDGAVDAEKSLDVIAHEQAEEAHPPMRETPESKTTKPKHGPLLSADLTISSASHRDSARPQIFASASHQDWHEPLTR